MSRLGRAAAGTALGLVLAGTGFGVAGRLEERDDSTVASTRPLTTAERQAGSRADAAPGPDPGRSVPLAMTGGLLLAAGIFLVTLTSPTPAERRGGTPAAGDRPRSPATG